MTASQDPPFVVFGDDWARYPSTIQHVFRHIAVDHTVVWVNGIGHRVPQLNLRDLKRGFEKIKRIARSRGGPRPAQGPSQTQALGGGVPRAIIDARVLPWHNIHLMHLWNTRVMRKAIQQRLAALGETRAPVLVTGSPPSVGVMGQLGELASVYFVMDDFLNFPSYTASMLAPLERRLLDGVDLVVATAASLTKSKVPTSGRAVHLPQGVNYSHFSDPRPEPADLAGIPHPRIGFAGSVSTQCDVELMVRLARTFPEASLVLVGPVGLEEAALAPLRLPNVHLMGVRPYAELPAYVQHFDVGIIPYVISAWTVAVDPLKLLEYLAAGLPVVTTAIPEAAKYAAHVAIAPTSDDFVAAVRTALNSDRAAGREKGQALARQNTWEQRAETFLGLVRGVLAEKGKR